MANSILLLTSCVTSRQLKALPLVCNKLYRAEIIYEQNASKIVKKYLNRWRSYVENKSGLLFMGHGI